ncbi:MAG TPA: hypothetical protein VMH39_02145 [Gemmatimonadaceae bacterium]|nr:hypothetical protein [Gemmatimonadaceae bacterium]
MRDVGLPRGWCFLALILACATLHAQGPVLPPVHLIGRMGSSLNDSLETVLSVRELSDGRVIVQAPGNHVLLVYDTAFARADTLLGGGGSAAQAYPAQLALPIIAGPADTTLLVDRASLALLVIDGQGSVRTSALPPGDIMLSMGQGTASDRHGRLVFRQRATRLIPTPDPSGRGPPFYTAPDSDPIVRFNMASLKIDTAGWARGPRQYPAVRTVDPDGTMWDTQVRNPLPQPDAWAVLADGTIAIVRAQDYHIDWISPDGVHSGSPRLPHQWHRYTDSEHTALLDSIEALARVAPQVQSSYDGTKSRLQTNLFPAADDLPNYEAAFVGPVYADADDRLWIRETRSDAGNEYGPVYEIVSRGGEVTARVRLPNGAAIVGFGVGCVYLSTRLGHRVTLVRFAIP